eukprot:TRINITY_DN17_c0_g1_i11.p1 TRINITY_DN17_c0_g1~~TRINITY_DN17_c0_g1_i11.p1  ORF type:complete len:1907 (+),score=300.21 TRINITY_DN17_c0_g1_i11:3672-9392(+)
MAWRKAFPSSLLLVLLILLTPNIINATSHTLHPAALSLATHMREYAVYANEDGVPKLERGDSPAQDPQIILGAPNSKSPATEPKPSPQPEPSPIATAIPPASPSQGEAVITGEQSESSPQQAKPTTAISQLPTYTCVNFGLQAINDYEMYDRDAVSGDAHVYAGSDEYDNVLPEAYWYYMYGQDWSYALDVSSSSPQNLVLGYAETSPEACDVEKSFTVSVNGGIQTADVKQNIGCGVIHQTELTAVAPVNGIIDISFKAASGDALVSVLCYTNAEGAETETPVFGGIQPTPEAFDEDVEEEVPTPSGEASTGSTTTVVQSDSAEEAANGGTCFSFGSTLPGFVNAATLPPDVSNYADEEVAISGVQEGSVFASHIYGSQFSLTIGNKDQAPKTVFIGLAEIYEPACKEQQRIFSITVGSLSIPVDVFDVAGCSAALVLRIDNIVPNSANDIEISFSGVKENAMVSAVCVTESVDISGQPSASFVSNLPSLSELDNSATITITSENPQETSLGSPVPSPTPSMVSIPSDTGVEPVDEPLSDNIVNPGEEGDGTPKGSPFPEFNGLIDATISESPVPITSDVATNPLSSSDEEEKNVDVTQLDTTTVDSQEDEVQHSDILLPTDFSQTTFGETPVLVPSSTTGISSDETSHAPMHPTGVGSSGFPQSAAVDEVEEKQGEEISSNESSEVIVVLEENVVPSPLSSPLFSPSPSAMSSPVQSTDIVPSPLSSPPLLPSPSAIASPVQSMDIVPSPLSSPPLSPSPSAMASPVQSMDIVPSPLSSPPLSPSPSAMASPVQSMDIVPSPLSSPPLSPSPSAMASPVQSMDIVPSPLSSPSLSPSPSAMSSPVQSMDSGAHNGFQAIQPTSTSDSTTPTSGVIIVAQGGDPVQQAPSPSAAPVPLASPDMINAVGGGGEQEDLPMSVSESLVPSPQTISEVALDMEQQESSQESDSSTTSSSTQSPTVDDSLILVAENEDLEIPSTPEEAELTITISDSDAEEEPIASAMPVDGSLEWFATAIPPGSTSTSLGSSDEGSSNDSDEIVMVAVDSDPVAVSTNTEVIPSLAPTPVSVALPPRTSTDGTSGDETGEVQVLVPDSEETSTSSSSSVDVVIETPVEATEISSQDPSPSIPVAVPPTAIVTDNQIEIVITGSPTVTPIPGTTSASSPGDEIQDVVIVGGETSDSDGSAVEAPDGVSLGGLNADGSSSDVAGGASPTPSPTPSLIVSVTGSDTVIISSTGAEASPIPLASGIPVAAPEEVAEVPDNDTNSIQVSDSENAGPVDSSVLTGDEDVPSIIEGEYKELIGTVPAGNGFSIGMGVLGAILVLLLLVLLFFAIRSDGVAYSYSSQYSSRKPSDYGDPSQGGFTEGLNQGAGVYQNDSVAGEGVGGYAQSQPLMESQPILEGAENFGYEQPQEGLGGANGSYGNVRPDTYAAYSSLNMYDAPKTMGDESNVYTQSEGVTEEGRFTYNYGSEARDTTFSGMGLRQSEQPTEYDEVTTQIQTEAVSHGEAPTSMVEETLPDSTAFEQRISMFGGRGNSHRMSSGQNIGEVDSFHENRSVARPNIKSASSGNQGRGHSVILQGTGYETVTNEMKEQYNVMQEAYLERQSGNVSKSIVGSECEGSEKIQSMSSTPTAAPSPYETDMQGQLVTDSDSGNVSYQRSPTLAPSESFYGASGDVRSNRVLRRVRSSDIHDDSVLDDYQYNESSLRESARQGHVHGTMELRSDLSNDGPWPWWWSDQKDEKDIFEQSTSRAHLEPEASEKENSSLPSNNQSPTEQSSSGLSTEDAKAAVVVDDTMILKPSEIAKLGHLPTTGSKWQRQYSSTSDGTSHERLENNPYFDELRKRREPYVKTVANRLSTGVKAYSTESGESILEQARREFEEQHSQQPSLRFNDNDPSSWVTQGVEV